MSEADEPLDEVDVAILAELAAAYHEVDPPPPGLDHLVAFAIALDHDDAGIEVARLAEDLLAGAGARAAEQSRTMTFDTESLTVMVAVVALAGGLFRLDGWLAPPAALVVDLRAGGQSAVTHTVTADDTGRFVIEAVPGGLAQLTVHLTPSGRTVVTPAVVL